MNKYIGIMVDNGLAENIRNVVTNMSEAEGISIIWQDTDRLILEVNVLAESSLKELLLLSESVGLPFITLEEKDLKNSPAEMLEYLDSIQWMKLKKAAGGTSFIPTECRREKYSALILGVTDGARSFLMKGKKGVKASSEAMKLFCDYFSELYQNVGEVIRQEGGIGYFLGGATDVLLPVSNKRHQLFHVCEMIRKVAKEEAISEILGKTSTFHQLIYIFPSELDLHKAREEARRHMNQKLTRQSQDGTLDIFIERRCGEPLGFEIPEDRISELDTRILLTCKSIGRGADYMQLLSRSAYDKDLLRYCRFLNHECQDSGEGV